MTAFFDLPREIRQMIYRHMYTSDRDIEVKYRFNWGLHNCGLYRANLFISQECVSSSNLQHGPFEAHNSSNMSLISVDLSSLSSKSILNFSCFKLLVLYSNHFIMDIDIIDQHIWLRGLGQQSRDRLRHLQVSVKSYQSEGAIKASTIRTIFDTIARCPNVKLKIEADIWDLLRLQQKCPTVLENLHGFAKVVSEPLPVFNETRCPKGQWYWLGSLEVEGRIHYPRFTRRIEDLLNDLRSECPRGCTIHPGQSRDRARAEVYISWIGTDCFHCIHQLRGCAVP